MRRVAIVLLVCLTACSPFAGLERMEDIRAEITEQKTGTKGLVEPLPEILQDLKRPVLQANPFKQNPQTVIQDWRDLPVEKKHRGRR